MTSKSSDAQPVQPLIHRAEQLRTFILNNAPARLYPQCRLLSLGNACPCVLCAVDAILAEITRLQQAMTDAEAQIEDQRTQKLWADGYGPVVDRDDVLAVLDMSLPVAECGRCGRRLPSRDGAVCVVCEGS